jgi:hypothetical protein
MEFKGNFQAQIPQPYNIFEWKNKILFEYTKTLCQNLESFVEWACQCCGLHSQFMPNQGKCMYDSIRKKIAIKSNLGIFELLEVLFMYTSQGWHSQQVWSYINTLHPCWVWFKLQNHTSCTINQLERFSLTKMSILKMNSLS